MANMDLKAGNKGDRLKHALLLEVLGRCESWDCLTYAETHAGAGLYSAVSQSTKKPKEQYIRQLREMVRECPASAQTSAPGGRYFDLLRGWWDDQTRRDQYPGSALQAVMYSRQQKERGTFDARVTEACEKTCKRLEAALQPYTVIPKHSGFQDQINWLCQEDNLVLLLDPFAIVGEVTDQDRPSCLNDGKVDLHTLRRMLDFFPRKSRAIALLWTSFGQQNRDYHGPLHRALDEWTQRNGTSYRRFHDKSSHNTYLIGFGEGREIVQAVPNGASWRESWLTGTIYEM